MEGLLFGLVLIKMGILAILIGILIQYNQWLNHYKNHHTA